jgi:hypothetical protein
VSAFIRIRNYDKFQHYKDRSPPWIKLHATTLEDYAFHRLQDASKAHLMLLWLLASRTDNKIPADKEWISSRIGARSPIDLRELEAAGFIELDQEVQQAEQIASAPLQQPAQSAMPEKEGEAEIEPSIANAIDGPRAIEVASVVIAKPKRKPAEKTSLPDDFVMPGDWTDWAIAERGLPATEAYTEGVKFIASAKANGRKYADWFAAWRYWIDNRSNFNGHARQPAESPVIAGAREAYRLIRERDEAAVD